MDQNQNQDQGAAVDGTNQPNKEASPQGGEQTTGGDGQGSSADNAGSKGDKSKNGQAPKDKVPEKQTNKIEVDLDTDLDEETSKKLLSKFSPEKLSEEMYNRHKNAPDVERNRVLNEQIAQYGELVIPDKKEFANFVNNDAKKFYEADTKVYDAFLDQAKVENKLDANGNLTKQALAVILPHLLSARAVAQRFNAQDKMPVNNTAASGGKEVVVDHTFWKKSQAEITAFLSKPENKGKNIITR